MLALGVPLLLLLALVLWLLILAIQLYPGPRISDPSLDEHPRRSGRPAEAQRSLVDVGGVGGEFWRSGLCAGLCGLCHLLSILYPAPPPTQPPVHLPPLPPPPPPPPPS